jgi:hypothetical protein
VVSAGVLSASEHEPDQPQDEQDRRDEPQEMGGESQSEKKHNKQKYQQDDHLPGPPSLYLKDVSRSRLDGRLSSHYLRGQFEAIGPIVPTSRKGCKKGINSDPITWITLNTVQIDTVESLFGDIPRGTLLGTVDGKSTNAQVRFGVIISELANELFGRESS